MYFDEFCERVKELTDNNTKYNSSNYVIYGNLALKYIYNYIISKSNVYYSTLLKDIQVVSEYVLPNNFVSIYNIYKKDGSGRFDFLDIDKFLDIPPSNSYTIFNSNELVFTENNYGDIVNIVYFRKPTLIYNEEIKLDKEEYQLIDVPFCCENLLIFKAVSYINARDEKDNELIELKTKEELTLIDMYLTKISRRNSKKLENVY